MSARIAVLVSGAGSNLQAILDYLDHLGDRRAAEVVVVASDRSGALALDRARSRGVTARTLGTNPDGSVALLAALREHAADHVVLAGYLSLVPPDVVRAYAGRIVNVHPALLPAFGGRGMYGARVHRAVIESGASVTGVTVHHVDEALDHGRIIAQWPVPVLGGDTAEALQARVSRLEHLLYPRVVHALAAGRVGAGSLGVVPLGARDAARFSLAAPDDRGLAEEIERALGL